ncbi:MAG TPA: LacI family DNA-binding transcriptional regulator [Phototrophicaceae bacterium]|nr:LacI family DNA-binding transcriptional regulator [Phototrophicaceae bacterium]
MATLKDVAERAQVSMATAYQILSGETEADDETKASVLEAADTLKYQLNITMRDVAAYAGVSITTVSYVINDNPLIKPTTRQLVRNAIRDLGYHPNTTARNLKTNETRLIGYAWHVAEDAIRRNPLLDLFLYELAQRAESFGYHILTFTQVGGIKAYEDLVNANRVDGFVLSDVVYDDPRIRRLLELKIPFAAYGKSNAEWDFPYVDVDGKRGIQLAVEHLMANGHERIGMISWPEGMRIGDIRTQGYIDTLTSNHLPIRESWMAHASNTLDDAFQAAQSILTSKPRPTAIVCANDVMAFGVKRYVESVGLEIGIDVALTGYDDTPVAELIGLTSVRQPIPLIANKVMELILTEIGHQAATDRQIILDPMLVVRASSRSSRKA